MQTRTKLARAERKISQHFDRSSSRVHTYSDLRDLFYKERTNSWNLARHTTFEEFLSFVIERGLLRAATFRSPHYEKEVTRYCQGSPSPFQLALSLRKSGYFSHGTAAFLHGLQPEQPTLYVNEEQSAKPLREKSLTQIGIDRAFAAKQRQSNLSYMHEHLTVTILNEKA